MSSLGSGKGEGWSGNGNRKRSDKSIYPAWWCWGGFGGKRNLTIEGYRGGSVLGVGGS